MLTLNYLTINHYKKDFMKKKILILLLFCMHAIYVNAQLPVVSSTPILHLDASYGVTSTLVGGHNLVSKWENRVGNFNHLSNASSGSQPALVTFTPKNGWAGSSFPALHFNYSSVALSYLESPSGITGLLPTDHEITVFVVATRSYGNGYDPTFISIAEPSSFDNGYALKNDSSVHSTDVNNYSYSKFSCSPDHERPVVYATRFGDSPSDIDRSDNMITGASVGSVGTPATFTGSISRQIVLGTRYGSTGNREYAYCVTGYIFEVVVYEGQLNNSDMDEITDYLRCKYEIFYTNCNASPLPAPCAKGNAAGCIETPSFVINDLGPDVNQNCTGEIVINGSTTNVVGYNITIPGSGGGTTFYPVGFGNVIPFTLVTPVLYSLIEVEIIGFDYSATPGTSPCCYFKMTQEVTCDALIPGTTSPTLTLHKGSTSIAATADPESIEIYPNPAYSKVYISNHKVNSTITITDMMGRQMLRYKTTETQTEIPVVNYPRGIYVIHISDEYGVSIKQSKVVLQ